MLDVREWGATVRRKTLEPVRAKTVETLRGTLTFRSETRLDHALRQMRIAERHTLVACGRTTTVDYDFVMRSWTATRWKDVCIQTSTAVEYLGGYAATTPAGSTDRLVVVASRARTHVTQ